MTIQKLQLTDSVEKLPYTGAAIAQRLARLAIVTIEDLLWHLPSRYQDLRNVKNISDVEDGELVTVTGAIEKITVRKSFRKRVAITQMTVADATGKARALWFNQPYLQNTFAVGDKIFLAGQVKKNLLDVQFANPIYEKGGGELLHTAHIIPYYPLTRGVSHKQLRRYIKTALDRAAVEDELPENIVRQEKLTGLEAALRAAHFPESPKTLTTALRRIKFEEFFWMQLSAAYAKRLYAHSPAAKISAPAASLSTFFRQLPFTLTADQEKAIREILADLQHGYPMNRLLQGDVGSGKTVVAFAAMFAAACANFQSALMVPTEVLAIQHYAKLTELLGVKGTALLTAQHTLLDGARATRNRIYAAIASGETTCTVGTHSLIQPGVHFARFGLAVIDEQHRFGVEQRKTLLEANRLKKVPHLLSLTATPIPRTLALTLYGDLDISTITQKPRGRKPIITRVIPESKRDAAYGFIRKKIREGQQAFIVCPLIEESDEIEQKAVLAEYKRLRDSIFTELTVQYLHGKMRAEEKKKILESFRANTFPILVTTSVIEVGIDIPNATIMVIEGAERFGLAQLHQFRGRIGRNNLQSYCLLFPAATSTVTRERLRMFCMTDDGFKLAEADLSLRGAGDIFGTRQSGVDAFAIASLRDRDLLEKAHNAADAVASGDTDKSFFAAHESKFMHAAFHRE